MEFLEWFISAAGMVTGSVFLTQFLKSKILPLNNDFGKWVLSLVSSEAFAFLGWLVVARYLSLGIFVDTETMVWTAKSVAITGVGITLVANNVFSLDDVKTWLQRLFGIVVNKASK